MKQLKKTQTRKKMSVTGMANGINSEIIKNKGDNTKFHIHQ